MKAYGAHDRPVADLNALGFLFESLVVRDLRVYAQSFDAQVLQYRDTGRMAQPRCGVALWLRKRETPV